MALQACVWTPKGDVQFYIGTGRFYGTIHVKENYKQRISRKYPFCNNEQFLAFDAALNLAKTNANFNIEIW